MQRGDVYQADLNPSRDSEQAGTRPVIVVSRDAINENSPVVVVVPLTGAENKRKIYPSQVLLKAGTGGLAKDSVVLGEQIRAISKSRLSTQLGHLKLEQMGMISSALKITLDLP